MLTVRSGLVKMGRLDANKLALTMECNAKSFAFKDTFFIAIPARKFSYKKLYVLKRVLCKGSGKTEP